MLDASTWFEIDRLQRIIEGQEWYDDQLIGHQDADGFLYLTGRVKEMFTVGGFNVSPPEIENFLLRHPAIKAVSVVGVPDDRLGEIGAAFIQLKEGQEVKAEEIISYCREKIADIKAPKYVFFVESFPLNPQGKIQKFIQREWAVNKLGLKARV